MVVMYSEIVPQFQYILLLVRSMMLPISLPYLNQTLCWDSQNKFCIRNRFVRIVTYVSYASRLLFHYSLALPLYPRHSKFQLDRT